MRSNLSLNPDDELGHFVELEVVLGENEPADAGVAIAHDLLAQLGISQGQLIEGAYVDMPHA